MFSKRAVRGYLDSLEIKPLKRFSQNFLIDQNIVDKIIATAQVKAGEHILEVGPGCGTMTRCILEKGARVTAIEIDKTLAGELRKLPIDLIEGDALQVPLPRCDKVISNLPYHIASPLLARLLPLYPMCTFMCQEEMARRITAQPGNKEYGSFTIFVRFYGTAHYAFKVSKHCFYPAPRIDSAVVHFERGPVPDVDSEPFFLFVQSAFQARRKKVATTWKKKYNFIVTTDARPEELRLEDFLGYYRDFIT